MPKDALHLGGTPSGASCGIYVRRIYVCQHVKPTVARPALHCNARSVTQVSCHFAPCASAELQAETAPVSHRGARWLNGAVTTLTALAPIIAAVIGKM